MKIKIKRFKKYLPLPERKTSGAAGFDVVARETTTIPPHAFGYVPMNMAVGTPAGCFLLVVPRSSTHKKGLIMANSVGIGDSDFCGDEDEYQAAYYNITDKPVVIEEGERIAQVLFISFLEAEWDEVDAMNEKNRGGFGSTGS